MCHECTGIRAIGIGIWAVIVGELVVPRIPYILSLPSSILLIVMPVTVCNLWVILQSSVGAHLTAALSWPVLLALSAHAIALEAPLILGNRLGNIPSQLMPPLDGCHVELELCSQRTIHLRHGLNFELVKGVLGPLLAVCVACIGPLPHVILTAFTVFCVFSQMLFVIIIVMSFPTSLRAFHNEPCATYFAVFPGYLTLSLQMQFGVLLTGMQLLRILSEA